MRRVRIRAENGQTLVVVALFMVVLLGMAAFAIDVGRAYVAYRHLQAATEAAGGAAAQYPASMTDAVNAGYRYSACTDPAENANCPGKNTYADLQNVSTRVLPQCVLSDGSPCAAGTANNAIHVEEQAKVSLFFGQVLGFGSMTLKAQSNVLFKGGVPHPLDVMVVLDTTGSMGSHCSATVSGIVDNGNVPTKLDCAKAGIRALLGCAPGESVAQCDPTQVGLWPCAQGPANCTPDPASPGNVLNPVDKVGLMVFPALVNDSAANLATRRGKEIDCSENLSSSDVRYTSPVDYVAVPLSSDFRASDTSPFNGASNLVRSVYWAQCPGGVYPSGGGGSSISGGPGSSSDVTGAANGGGSSITGGPGSSADVTGAANGSGGGSIGAGVPSSGSDPNDRSSNSNSSGNSSITISRPPTQVAGDFLLATVSVRDMAATENICAPSGWTAVLPRDESVSGTSRLIQQVFWKFATASSDTSNVFTFRTGACPSGGSTVSRRAIAMMIRYTGVDPANPIDVHLATTVTSASAGLTAPAVTTNFDNERVVNLYGFRGTTSTSISGATFSFNNGSSSNNLAMAGEDFTQATAGLTPAGAATSSSSGLWVGQTVALKAPPAVGAPSISIARPTNRADGDFLLVSVTARSLGTGSICAPDGTWTLVRQDPAPSSGGSLVTQATFWSFRTGTTAETYTFSFRTGGCPAGGSPVSVQASAIAVRYTNVDLATPVDIVAGNTGNTGAGTAIPAPAVTTTFANDRVVRLYSSACTTMSGVDFAQSGSTTSTGAEDATQATPNPTPAESATSCTSTDSVAHTVALKLATVTSISIARPTNRAAGDFLLVSVTAQGLGTGSICAPDGTWTLVRQDPPPGSGGSSVTQATFWSFRFGTSAETYAFSFRSGACPAGGSLVSVQASAVAVRYTNVDTATSIDASEGSRSNTGTGTTLTAPQVTTTFPNDRVVRLYGSACTSMSNTTFSQPGSVTRTGIKDANQATAGPTATGSAATANSCSNTDWVAHTVALKFGGCTGNCFYGAENPGGSGSYTRDAINAAQAYLNTNGRLGATHVIIVLSDGEFQTTLGDSRPCHSAITAATNARTAGTWVFSIAYNSPSSSDESGGNTCPDPSPGPDGPALVSPYGVCTMHRIADPLSPCTDNSSDPTMRFFNQPSDGDLQAIFKQIGTDLTTTRIVPP